MLSCVALCLGLLWPCMAAAQESEGSEVVPAKTKPVWQQTNPDADYYLKNRRALVGPGCTVNKIVNVVGVGSWVDDLNNLTDEDLDNYVEFPKIVGVGLTAVPVTSVRDLNNHYAAGTKAGFCLVASSGTSVLSLDVIKAMSLLFYCDGKLVGDTVQIEEGQVAGGVGLSLISIPGLEEACIYVTGKCDEEFDEVCLLDAGGVNLTVGSRVQIKYAFVGDVNEMTFTHTSVSNVLGTDYDLVAEGWNPVLLGIPLPLLDDQIANLTDDDYTNRAIITPIVSLIYKGGVKFTINPPANKPGEVFPAGTEVGFRWNGGAVLSLDVGAWIEIVVFNRNGDKIKSYTVSGDVLSLGVADGKDNVTSVVTDCDFSRVELRFMSVLGVNVAATGVFYGFVREQPEIPHHCDISPTVSTNICDEQNSFQLESNPDLSVTWSLEDFPDESKVSVTPGGYVTNMDINGDYGFRATAADGCFEIVTLTKGDNLGMEGELECGQPLVNEAVEGLEDGIYELSYDSHGFSGALLNISGDLKNAGNIINSVTSDSATYSGGLSVAENTLIVGVKRTDGEKIFDGGKDESKRVGFVVEYESTGLSLSALDFYRIRCFNSENGDDEVYSGVITETDVVSLGLAGSNRVQKLRFCIDVPKYNKDGEPIVFDEFQLWQSGVLSLDGEILNIYYPFIEPATSDCGGVMSCVTSTISVLEPYSVGDEYHFNGTNGTNASINGNATQMGSAVQVVAVWDSLSYLIDNDLNTAFLLWNTVSVGGGHVIAVKTGRTLDFRHQLCLLVDKNTYLAGVKVGGWLTVSTYYRGEPTGDEFTEWNVLGVNAIGYGDKSVLVMHPKLRYDEVRIEVAAIANVLEPQQFYGFFLRGDIDNDGIPDCQDPESCFSNVTELTIDPLCVGDYMQLSGKGMSSTDYTLRLPEQGIDTTFTTDTQGGFSLTFQLNTPGRYDMLFYDGSSNLVTTSQYSVHPLQTTWKTQPVSTDWNEWTNWTNGSPYCCTDVIIPTGATAYPLLSQPVTGEGNADEYCCDDIHFEPGAAVDVTPRLNYMRAWAEMELAPNRYYLLSAPLKHTYTGDMFIPAEPKELPYFEEVTVDNTPQNRFNPRIYQRLWATTAKGRLRDGPETDLGIDKDFNDGIAVEETRWSKNFNHLAHKYPMGNGFSLWVDNGELPASQTFRFRFPKEHTSYNYYEDFDGSELTEAETLVRGEGDDNKRFVYEGVKEGAENVGWTYERRTTAEGATSQQSRTVYAGELPLTVTLTSEEKTKDFLTGNPFMSRIYLKGFFEDNSSVTAVRVYDGENYVTVNKEALSTADVEYIEPMQAFFVTLGAEASSATVTFDEASLNPEAQEEGSSGAETQAAALRVTADNGAVRAAALLVDGETTSVATLFDDEVPPVLSVFSLSDDEAFDIRNMGEDGCTSLGIYQPEKGDSLTLSFAVEHGLALADYRLLDRATGTLWALDAPVVLRGIGTSVNRYAVVPADYEPEPVAAGEVYVELQGTVATAYSLGAGIAQLSVFTTDGRRTSLTDGRGGQQASVSLSRGLHILQVRLSDGTAHAFKLLVR